MRKKWCVMEWIYFGECPCSLSLEYVILMDLVYLSSIIVMRILVDIKKLGAHVCVHISRLGLMIEVTYTGRD